MKKERLIELFDKNDVDILEWVGKCHDCEKQVVVIAERGEKEEDGRERFEIDGGAVYEVERGCGDYEVKDGEIYLKCEECFEKDRVLRGWRECEVYSRVVGYLRPISQWNDGKREEFNKRRMFEIE